MGESEMTPEQAEEVIMSYLKQHEEPIREAVRSRCQQFRKYKDQFSDMREVFESQYKAFLVDLVREYVENNYGMNREQTMMAITFPVLRKAWSISELGDDV